MSKDEVKALIDRDIDKAFENLDEVFGLNNATYNDFSNEYISPPSNFNITNFRSRLKRFVQRSPEFNPKNKDISSPPPVSEYTSSGLTGNVKKLISQNKVKKAIQLLLDAEDRIDSDIYGEILTLSGRFNRLVSAQRMGIKSSSEINVETNTITFNLLEIANTL